MTNQNTADDRNKEEKGSVNKHYGYDNWYWLMDQPLDQNLKVATSSQDRS